MRDIKELIDNTEEYKNALLQHPFDSKKNTVGYVILQGQPRVLKWFAPGLKQNMEREYSILKKGAQNVCMPSVLQKDTDNNVLVQSYIVGENLCDIINDDKIVFELKKKIMELLADWCVTFHSFFRTEDVFLIRGDANIRNFLFSQDRVYGVDFEESRVGNPNEDLAGLCASILSTNPMFTEEKFRLCEILIESYRRAVKWEIKNINKEIAYALLERIQWRPSDEETLRKYAAGIRTTGLRAARHNY